MKLHFSYNNEQKDGFETRHPGEISILTTPESVDEISGSDVLEKVPNLIWFINTCHHILKPGGIATFSAPYYASGRAWASPLTVRGLSETSLNFSNKQWREDNKWVEAESDANFVVQVQFAVDQAAAIRSEESKTFWMNKFNNVVQVMVYTLTKTPLD